MTTCNKISYSQGEISDLSLYKHAEEVISLLQKLNLSVTTTESCTGGMVAAVLTAVPGSSEIYEGGFVTYSNRIKSKLVHVRHETLLRYGAVSEQTVYEMATGALKAFDADISVSVSGIAGPTGGTIDKPVGTVWFGYCSVSADGKEELKAYHCQFSGDREHVRRSSVKFILTTIKRNMIESSWNTDKDSF